MEKKKTKLIPIEKILKKYFLFLFFRNNIPLKSIKNILSNIYEINYSKIISNITQFKQDYSNLVVSTFYVQNFRALTLKPNSDYKYNIDIY